MEISQDQLCGEQDYGHVQRQSLYDDHILDLCRPANLNVWYRIGEEGKKIESFTKDIQGTKEAFMNLHESFLQRLTSTGKRMIADSEDK